MSTANLMKATSRTVGGKGAARAERRAGRVPGVIYGNNKSPIALSLDHKELRTRIYAGRFLTTVLEIELDGGKHRVIPRDFQLDPLRDLPLHVDFLRLGVGATLRVSVPLHVNGTEAAPGVKRGGTVNIVNHTVELEVDADHIPPFLEIDASQLDIAGSIHLSDLTLPKGAKSVLKDDITLVTIVAPSGLGEEAAAPAAAAAAAPAAKAAAPAPKKK